MTAHAPWLKMLPNGPGGFGDWMLGGAGVSAAALSAGFACYMVAVGPVPRGADAGSDDFKVFVNFDRRANRMPPAEAAVLQPVAAAPEIPRQANAVQDVDYTPTGSIGPRPQPVAASGMPALAGGGSDAEAAPRVLPGYAVHDVFDGKAVVEVRNKLTIVEPGSVVEGAGEVLAIRREGAGWVVQTAGGIIGQ